MKLTVADFLKQLKKYTNDDNMQKIIEKELTRTSNRNYVSEEMLEEIEKSEEALNRYDRFAYYSLAHVCRELELMDISFYCFTVSASQNYVKAIYWLGNYYYEGFGTKEDFNEAFRCYETAAKAGLADAMNNYADMYFRGETVSQSDEIAYKWFHKAAMLGVSEAMFTLGYMYERGVGIDMDLETSIHWFKRAALLGDLYAANYLGHKAMERGAFHEAFTYYQQAADGQDVEGEYNVGFCYEEGVGVEQNVEKAMFWYKKAVLQGDELAKIRLEQLKNSF